MHARVPELVALDVEVEACAPSRFPYGASFWAYAAVLKEIAAVDPEAATQAHGSRDTHKSALLTVSGLLKDGVPALSTIELDAGEPARMRVCAVGERLVIAAARALAPSRRALTLSIGPSLVNVTGITPAALCCPNPASLDDLQEQASAARGCLRLRFVSPTTFERRGLWYAMPAPEAVFGRAGRRATGLFRHWLILRDSLPESFCPDHVGAVPGALSPCTGRLVLDGGMEWAAPAFTGECEFSAPEDETAVLHTLGLLAQFTGIGQRISFGMGRVEVVPPSS